MDYNVITVQLTLLSVQSDGDTDRHVAGQVKCQNHDHYSTCRCKKLLASDYQGPSSAQPVRRQLVRLASRQRRKADLKIDKINS